MQSTSRLAEILAELYARAPRGMRLGVEAIDEACARFDRPERAFPAVHVAGTNGKGSTCAMIEAAARAQGLRTGLYTSPHLARFAERIRVDGTPIDDDHLEALLTEVLRREPDLTFFEAATLTAFLAFRAAKVDLAVLEVGIGGRLDATNVIPSAKASVVTRIALDHMDKLGDTLEAIAHEKAAIAKPGCPLFIGPLPTSLADLIASDARTLGAEPRLVTDDPRAVEFRASCTLTLGGEHQRDNAMIAFSVARALGWDEEKATCAIEGAKWPGRLERIALPEGPVLFDAAHNPDGAEALVRALRSNAPMALVFGALADKDWRPMLDLLAPLTEHRFYAPPRGRIATDPAELAARHAGATCADGMTAYASARAAIKGGLVVVCGSISLVGEIRSSLLNEPRDPPIAL